MSNFKHGIDDFLKLSNEQGNYVPLMDGEKGGKAESKDESEDESEVHVFAEPIAEPTPEPILQPISEHIFLDISPAREFNVDNFFNLLQ